MPKCKKPIDELTENLKKAEEEINNAVKEEVKEEPVEKDVDKMRSELIQNSEDGEIEQSVKYLKKASEKPLRKFTNSLKPRDLKKQTHS